MAYGSKLALALILTLPKREVLILIDQVLIFRESARKL